MNKYLTLLIILVSTITGVTAKEIKEPDTYAYTRGKEALGDQNEQEALSWFEKELADHPDNGYAYVYISVIRSDNDEYGKAFTAIEQALKKLPSKDKNWIGSAYGIRAAIHLAMNDTVEAINDYARAIKTDPTRPLFYRNRGNIYYLQDRYDLSDADFHKMIELDKGDVTGYMGVGRNATAQERWDEAIEQFDYAVRLEPEYSSGYSFRAQAYIGKEKWNEATDDIIKALGIDGDEMAYHLMLLLPSDAAGILKSKLKVKSAKQPSEVLWPYCLALLSLNENNYDEAIEYYTKCNSIDANPALMTNIAECKKYKHDYAGALDYYNRALNMNKDDEDVVLEIANILSMMGKREECIEMRDRYIELDPENPIGYLSRAVDLSPDINPEKALEDFDTASALSPQIGNLQYYVLKRAETLSALGREEEATPLFRRILDQDSDLIITSCDYLPFAHLALGDSVKATESMNTILLNDTTDSFENFYNAACLFARLNDRVTALEKLKKAFEKGAPTGHAMADEDLDLLHGSPEFDSLIEEFSTYHPNEENAVEESYETVEIPFTKEGGVTKVQCAINGLPLHFVFDTGAADVTMSMVEANFMLKNDYIKSSDIIGSARYMDANGDITEGTVINLKKVDLGGLELNNVRASVVRNQKAPLLLGQSVLGRLGKIQIDNSDMKLIVTHYTLK